MVKVISILLTLVVVALCVASGLATTSAPDKNDEEQIKELIRRWDEALVKRDVDFINSIVAEDFSYIDAGGELQNKRQHLALIKSPDLELMSINSSDVTVRLYKDTAVAIAKGTIQGKYKTQPFKNNYRYSDVWVKRRDVWQVVATQVTDLPQ